MFGPRLIYGRPLRHYTYTFFLPLDLPKEWRLPVQREAHRHAAKPPGETNPAGSEAAHEAQAWWYFTPVLRDLLFDTVDTGNPPPVNVEPLREWQLNSEELKDWQLELSNARERDEPLRFQIARITRLRLFRYFNNQFLLAWTVEPAVLEELRNDDAAAPLFCEGPGWWRALALTPEPSWKKVQSLQLNAWLRFTRLARLLYPAYPEQLAEDKIASLCLTRPPPLEDVPFPVERVDTARAIPRNAGQALSLVVQELLAAFFGSSMRHPTHQKLENYRDLYDDRMFVNVSYGPAGQPPDIETNQRLFATALFVDCRQDTYSKFDDYPYDPAWLKPRLEEKALSLWRGRGQLYGFTDLSNVYLGYRDFYCNTIAPVHVHFIYERMLIQALFYQASLRHYARRITEATGQLTGDRSSKHQGAAQALREEFIRFTNQYWFHDITPQLQGREIFRRQQAALELERDYSFIKDEMERTYEFTEALFHHRLQQLGGYIAGLGVIIGVAALWPVWLTFLKDFEGEGSIRGALQKLGWFECLPSWVADHLFLWVAPLLLIVVAFWALRLYRRRRQKGA